MEVKKNLEPEPRADSEPCQDSTLARRAQGEALLLHHNGTFPQGGAGVCVLAS